MQGISIDRKIIQAPMAGVTTPELVAEVSKQGGIGSIGAGYLSQTATKAFIRAVKKQTNEVFSINLFVPEGSSVNEEQIKDAKQALKFAYDAVGSELSFDLTETEKVFNDQIDLVIEESLAICSFTFGIPEKDVIRRLKKANVYLIGTATTVEEAMAVESAGLDAVVMQGSEAGGHRGSFLRKSYPLIGLMSLLSQVKNYVSIPIIAAGGIMTGSDIKACYELGANAVQLGTAFLMTEESGAHPLHKKAILEATEEDLVLTKSFSGKLARGINNNFIKDMQGVALLPYPYQNDLTKELRRVAQMKNEKNYLSLWAGQNIRQAKLQRVKELMASLYE